MEQITIHSITDDGNSISFTGFLIREDNPRLALCQDRVCQLDKDNNVLRSVDLLSIFH